MTEQQRQQIRAELARRMGYTARSVGTMGYYQLHDPNGQPVEPSPVRHAPELVFTYAPDPFNSAEDNRALVKWICSDKSPTNFDDDVFLSGISKIYGQLKIPYSKREIACAMWDTLNAPLEAVTLAAARALGIQEAGE